MRRMYIIMICVGLILTIIGIIGMVNRPPAPNVQKIVSDSAPVDSLVQPASDKSFDNKPKAKRSLSAKEKGNLFESYIANCFADKSLYTLLEWNQGTTSSKGVYAENELHPDFKVRHKFSDTFNVVYWVECKYQSFHTKEIRELEAYQIERYRNIQRESHKKVLLALGEGSDPSAPEALYLVPLDSVKDNRVTRAQLNAHRVNNPLSSLPSYIKSYFNTQVFNK